MELFYSFLTGFFVWLLLFQSKRRSTTRLRAMAGKVVYSVKSDRSRGWCWALFVLFLLFLIHDVITALKNSDIPLESQFVLAALFFLVLMIGIPAGIDNALKVTEQGFLCEECGILHSLGRLLFVPWNQIDKCQWVPFGFGKIAHIDKNDNRLIIAEDSITRGNRADLTAALGRFVSVFDETGGLLAKPEQDKTPEK
jgi:hypothetical protein